MNPELIWENFSSSMADIVLSQRATKELSDIQLRKFNEQENLRKEQGLEDDYCSMHNMSFIDHRIGSRIFYSFKKLTIAERMTKVVLKKNREYQFLIMEAYEKFEDSIENIYAYLGENNINFWPLSEFGNKKYNEISSLDFAYYRERAEKRKGGAISIAKMLIERFDCDCVVDQINLKHSIIFIEKIRHIVVHRAGITSEKQSFLEAVAKECGLYNNGSINNIFISYMEYFFGDGVYENTINITEERINKEMPILIERSRFELLLDAMMLCVFILCHESKKHIEELHDIA